MRSFWRAGTFAVVLAIAGAPLSVKALSPPNHIAQKNPQLVQVEEKGGEHKGGNEKGNSRWSGSHTNLSDRGKTASRVRSSEYTKSPALRRVDRDDRGRLNRSRIDRVAGRHDGDRHRGVRYFWGPGAEFFFYDGYYHGDCSWLRRKAEATGSRYWWRRYRLCRELD